MLSALVTTAASAGSLGARVPAWVPWVLALLSSIVQIIGAGIGYFEGRRHVVQTRRVTSLYNEYKDEIVELKWKARLLADVQQTIAGREALPRGNPAREE